MKAPLFTHAPHPRIRSRRRERPPQMADERVGFNGRLAAVMTKSVGSMWVVYFTTAFVLGWIFLAQLGPLGFDKYPFPFLLLLGNVIQLLLVFVILVGQQVLGAAVDKRALQTYQDAEAILREVQQLHAHLEAQDKVLTRGISLCSANLHPWIEARSLEGPVRVANMHIGFNGRIGSFITRLAGTMWAFYLATVFQLGWIVLALLNIIQFDPYPFAFLLFLSSLVQLILMFVIMVGQQVLGAAGDRRAQQTYQDAEAILQECEQLHTHLQAQDEVIVQIVDELETSTAQPRIVTDGKLRSSTPDAEGPS
jgi:uncharacterized membrane protein